MTRDPSGMTDGPNLYAYVGNRPTYAFDPFGEALNITAARGLQMPGPLGYLSGDTLPEQLGAGAYNVIPELGNTFSQVLDAFGFLDGLLKELFTTLAGGDQKIGEGLYNAATLVIPVKGPRIKIKARAPHQPVVVPNQNLYLYYAKKETAVIGRMRDIEAATAANPSLRRMRVSDEDVTKLGQSLWEKVNKPWLDGIIATGDDVLVVSTDLGEGTKREIQYLLDHGYDWADTAQTFLRKTATK